ncbi:MAG: PEGA domain-containing protein [bacterium]|nr:PEGA domain-containing protein [bacterium]
MPRSDVPTRAQLTRILDLPSNASEASIGVALDRLLAALRARREADETEGPERRRLDEEIARLEAARPIARAVGTPDRLPLIGALLGTIAGLAALFFYSGGPDDTRAPLRTTLALSQKPRLELEGPLPAATLRIYDADRTRIVAEMRAEGAVHELDRGRFALEVTRPDCPDAWTRSVYFGPGTVHRFAPTLCTGEGRLIVRANVPDAEVKIDGAPFGAPGDVAHTLSVGEHEVVVERDGFRRWVERVRIRPEARVELTALLLPEREPALRARRLDLGFDAKALAPPPPRAPTPFDMGDLAESIAPDTRRPVTRLLEREGLGGLPDGGSTAWHDRVRREFLNRFDSDASGRIDRFEESESISCTWWRETEQSFDEGGLGLSMARYYGFDGSEWHPGALGFERSVRGVAYERMRGCGLQAQATGMAKARI